MNQFGERYLLNLALYNVNSALAEGAVVVDRTARQVVLGLAGIGVLCTVNMLASALPLVYGGDDKTECGARTIVEHFSTSLGAYCVYGILAWSFLGSKITGPPKWSLETAKHLSTPRLVTGFFWLVFRLIMPATLGYWMIMQVSADFRFVKNMPPLPTHRTAAACEAAGD